MKKGFQDSGFSTRVQTLADFQEDYGLKADESEGEESDEDDDDDMDAEMTEYSDDSDDSEE